MSDRIDEPLAKDPSASGFSDKRSGGHRHAARNKAADASAALAHSLRVALLEANCLDQAPLKTSKTTAATASRMFPSRILPRGQ